MADKFQLAQKNRVGKDFQDAKKNRLMFYKGKDGKKKAAVSKTDLEAFRKRENNPDLTLRDYLNKMQGKTKRKDTKTAKPVATNKDVVKTDNKGRDFVAPKERKKVSSVGSGTATTITGKAKTKSATQINRELKEKIKSPKVLGKKEDKVEKKSDDKKRSKSLFKRLTGLATKPEDKKNKKKSGRGMGIFFGKNKNKINNKKTTSSYNTKTDPTAISYKKGGGNVFVARQYGGKIGD